jgi:hypothetical protein
VKLGDQIFVLATAALDALSRGHAGTATAHLLLPLKLGRLVMDPWVPNEVQVQEMAQVETSGILV